jgi:membrane protease YdiL (CAAX protease family)
MHDPSAGLRLLFIVFLLEAVIGPRLWLFTLLGLTLPPSWLRVALLMVAALMLVRLFAGLSLSQIGLCRWRDWRSTEKSYFVQTFFIANLVFGILYMDRLRAIVAEPSMWARVGPVLATSLVWGFYQEVVYRGILQTELVRRIGALRGILVANVLFTFGPLHFYHFDQPSSALPMFAGIFAIGLFFAMLFQRSGNLWIVGIFHGLGDSYILGTLVR